MTSLTNNVGGKKIIRDNRRASSIKIISLGNGMHFSFITNFISVPSSITVLTADKVSICFLCYYLPNGIKS